MQRREALKYAFIIGAGTLLPHLLTGCADSPLLGLKRLSLSRRQELLLELLTDTIIPQTGTPGAKALKVHVFVARMIDDCSDSEGIEMFKKGMEQFEKTSVNGKKFEQASAEERLLFLSGSHGEILQKFLDTVKQRTIEGYVNSEYVMTKLVPYKLAPGPFKGTLKPKSNEKRTI